MGILQDRRERRAADRAITAAATYRIEDPSTFPIASPWSTSAQLERVMFSDIFGEDIPSNTRAAAMRIPAIARGRNLLVSSIAQLPLAGWTATGPLPKNPTWMTAAAGGVSPQHRLAWIVDDLIFYGWSCLFRENGSDGFPLTLQRVNQGDWCVNADNRVEVNGQEVEDNQVILVPGLHEGLLSFGRETLADARSLYQIVRDRLASPIPPIDLHQTGGRQLTNDEIDETVDRWVAARTAGRAVGYSSEDITVNVLEAGGAELMIEARNAASLDLARVIGVTAAMVDATSPKSTLNYETTTGRNQEFADRDLLLYMTPIVARLSLDDVMPHGQRCVFDTSAFTGPTMPATGPTLED